MGPPGENHNRSHSPSIRFFCHSVCPLIPRSNAASRLVHLGVVVRAPRVEKVGHTKCRNYSNENGRQHHHFPFLPFHNGPGCCPEWTAGVDVLQSNYNSARSSRSSSSSGGSISVHSSDYWGKDSAWLLAPPPSIHPVLFYLAVEYALNKQRPQSNGELPGL